MTDSLKSFLKRRQLADLKSSLMTFPSLATLKRIQTDLFECSTCFSFVWEVKRENGNDKGGVWGRRLRGLRSLPFPPPPPPFRYGFLVWLWFSFRTTVYFTFRNTHKKTASYAVYTYAWYNMAIGYYRLCLYVLDIRNGNCMIITCSKIQLVVYYQCCVLIGWATTRLYVIAH